MKKILSKPNLGTLLFVGLVSMTVMAGPNSTAPEPISDALCLRKMSLDLTYRGPSDDELANLESGTLTFEQMADGYLASTEFEQVLFDWYRSQFPPTELSTEFPDMDIEEPSRIARHIVVEDLDYRLILTGDFTITPEGEKVSSDNGPSAGLIGTKHYMSAFSGSYRRNWAGHFLKEWAPIELKAITLPANTKDADITPDSLMTNPACSGCHASEIYGIDFLAPFGSCYNGDGSYNSDCEEPGGTFLTEKGLNLADLGTIVTDSNEFMAISVNFFYKKLFGRSMAYNEKDYYLSQVKAFRASGYKAKALIKSIVTSPEYCSR